MNSRNISLILTFLFFLSKCFGQSDVSYIRSQSLSITELNFNEIFATLTDDKENMWMLGGSQICRNTGYDVDCFTLPISQSRNMFFIGKGIVGIINKTHNEYCFFDLKTYKSEKFNVPASSFICRNSTGSDGVVFINKENILQYDFVKKATVKIGTIAIFPYVQFIKYYKTSTGNVVRLYADKFVLDNQVFPIDKIDVVDYLDFVELKDGYIINSGKAFYFYNKKTHSFTKIYTDNFDCKKLWLDAKSNLLMALPHLNQCNTISKLYMVKSDIGSTEKIAIEKDLSHLIDQKDYEAAVINCNGENFQEKINFATHMGMYSYAKHNNAFTTELTVSNKSSRFGRVLKGIVKDDKGKVYYCGEENNIYIQNLDNSFDTIPIKVVLNDTIRTMTFGRNLVFDEKRNLIYGVCGQYKKFTATLFAMDIKSKKIVKEIPIKNRIYSMYRHKQMIYLATSDHLVLEYDIDEQKLDTLMVFKDVGVRTRVLYAIDDDLLIGTEDGLYTYNLSSKKLSENKILAGVSLMGMTHDKNNLYVSSNLTGIYVVNRVTNKITQFNKENGLSNNSVNITLPLDNGKLLASTEKGINIIDMSQQLILPLTKDRANISDNEFNTISYLIDADKIYLGSVNGATIIDRKQLDKSNNYEAEISKLEVHDFGKEAIVLYNGISKLSFSPITQKLVIYFGSTNKNSKVSFAYKPDQSSQWKVLTSNKLELIRPISNQINLQVICSDENGIWSDKVTNYEIEIQQHFYNKIWFYILMTSLISAMIYAFSRWRIKEINAHNDEITSINKRVSELNLTALQSQMNPHFLFNAMSSIQYHLTSNNLKKAEEVLSSFGKLIRMILESSKAKTWSLEKEIEMLTKYIDIEKEKFDKDELNVSFNTLQLANKGWQIPPMIIQPYIENAFNHAFVMMEEKAELHIDISDKEEIIIVNIIDNGIGIDKSKSYKKNVVHDSMGMNITQERIAMYNDENKSGKIELIINDNSNIKGTSIKIMFPKQMAINK